MRQWSGVIVYFGHQKSIVSRERERGNLGWFLLTMPPDEPIKLNDHRLTDTERSGYEKFITNILSVREKTLTDGKVKPIVFDLSSEAFDLLKKYQHKHADLAVYETDNNSGAEGKFMTNAARIALILHIADLYDGGLPISENIPISVTTIRNACIIAEWFVNEAKRIYVSLVGGYVDGELSTEQREVMKVLRRINKPATQREMKRASRVLQRMDLDEVLRELVRLGRLQEQFRDDSYHKNGALEYRISSVATVDADTMLIIRHFQHRTNPIRIHRIHPEFSLLYAAFFLEQLRATGSILCRSLNVSLTASRTSG